MSVLPSRSSILRAFVEVGLLVGLCASLGACSSGVESSRSGRLVVPEPPSGTQGAAAPQAVELGRPEEVASTGTLSPGIAGAAADSPGGLAIAPAAGLAVPPTAPPVIVYMTRTGSKYHLGSCRFLSRSKIPIDLEQARKVLTPCKVCRPPK